MERKERPILFSAPMVRAILSGKKTQTRRVIKGAGELPGAPSSFSAYEFEKCRKDGSGFGTSFGFDGGEDYLQFTCPYGRPGNMLWVRETFFDTEKFKEFPIFAGGQRYLYRADKGEIGCHKWKPSIHMPRLASRINLEITGIRVEQLHEISENDARAEGASLHTWFVRGPGDDEHIDISGLPGFPDERASARNGFANLWTRINGLESWDANPWVWVIEFKRCQA